MLRLDLTLDARKFLASLDAKQFRHVVNKVFDLMRDPKPQDVAPLKGYEHYWRATIGEHRIIYRFDDGTLYIIIIGKRNDDEACKSLPRKA